MVPTTRTWPGGARTSGVRRARARTRGGRPGPAGGGWLLAASTLALCLLLSAAGGAAGAADPVGAPGGTTGRVTAQVVRSFDGVPIYSTLFLPLAADAAHPVPLVLYTHGWAGHGERDAGAPRVRMLLDAGYAVLTWDARGFGWSGGQVELDKPGFEGRDVSALLDWVSARSEILLDGPGDPVVGWVGQSYGGGIQLAGAAVDRRVDALAPEIAWSDLRYSLFPNGVVKTGWGEALYTSGLVAAGTEGLDPRNPAGPQLGGLDPAIHRAHLEAITTNSVSQATLDYLGASSLVVYGRDRPVAVPTLVMQGSVDTLFNLTDGNGIYQHVRATGAPAKLIVFCGGHIPCPSTYAAAGDRDHLDRAILTWFAKYLRGQDVDTGPAVEYRTNEGVWRAADDFPPSDLAALHARGAGVVISTPLPGAVNPTFPLNPSPSLSAVTPALIAVPSLPGDPRAMTVPIASPSAGRLELVGIPAAELTVQGIGPSVHLFLKLVDREAHEVVNFQETPVRVEGLTGEAERRSVELTGVAYTLPAGHHLDLEISTASLLHANARVPSEVRVTVAVSVPVRRSTR